MPSYGRVAGLKIELEIDGSKVTKYLSTSAKEVGKLQSSLKDLNKSLKLNPTNTELIKQKFELLGKSIDSARNYLADLKNQFERLSRINDPTQKQIDQMNNLQREISDTEQELKKLQREYDSFGGVGIQKTIAVGQQMQELGNKIKSVGQNIQNLGREWEVIGAPLQALFGYSIKEAAGFEQGMANVKAVTQANDEDLTKMAETARQWARKTVYSAEEVTDAYWYMGLAGLSAEESMSSLGGVLDLAAASNIDLGNATSIVVDTMTALGMGFDGTTNGIDNTTHAANIFAAAMSNSNTTTELMGETFSYVAPYIGALNGNLEDLALATGLMASSGVKGSKAGTALRFALSSLTDPTDKQLAAMEKFNISLDDGYGNARPLRDVLVDLRKEFGGLDLQLLDANGELKDGEQLWEEYGDKLPATQMEKLAGVVQMFGKRALPGMLSIINASEEDWEQLSWAIDNADGSMVNINGDMMTTKDVAEKFGTEAADSIMKVESAFGGLKGSAEAMRETRLDTFQGQVTLLRDNFNDLAIDIGNLLLPYINEFVEWLGQLINKFRNLSPETKDLIIKIGLIVAAVGPVLMIIGSVVGAIGTIVGSIGSLISGIGSVIGFISTIVSVVGAAPALIIAAVVGLTVFLATHWEEFCSAVSELWNSLVEFFTALWEGLVWVFTDTWNAISQFAIDTWNAISQTASDVWNAVVQFFVDTWNAISQGVSDAWNAIVQFFTDTWNAISQTASDIWNAVVQFFTDTWNAISQTASDVWNAISGFFTETWNAISGTATDIWNSISSFFSDTWNSISETATSVWGGISSFLSDTWGAISSTADSMWQGIQRFIEDPIGSVKTFVEDAFNAIQGFMEDPIAAAQKFIDDKIQAIKNLFPLSIGKIFSNIQLPSIDWDWLDVGGILKIPTFSVSWHAKAMKNGMLLDGATIFGQGRNGELLGGGEVGREWIIGENGLYNMIRGAMSENQLSSDVIYSAVVRGMADANITVYMDGKKVTNEVGRQAAISADAQRRYFGVR